MHTSENHYKPSWDFLYKMKVKPLSIFLLDLILVISSSIVLVHTTMAAGSCDEKCGARCSKAALKDRCLKYCGICCRECNNCVPSGTYGNKDECPCYRDKQNSKGKPKCP